LSGVLVWLSGIGNGPNSPAQLFAESYAVLANPYNGAKFKGGTTMAKLTSIKKWQILGIIGLRVSVY
jgi:hypothetical protein